jgi:hypothetical protein
VKRQVPRPSATRRTVALKRLEAVIASSAAIFYELLTYMPSHHPDLLAFIELSLPAAALAKIPADRTINMSVTQLKDWVAFAALHRNRPHLCRKT